ncbi:MAG: hypothetical protein ABW115_21745, partial [Candidatus Thiodiazotropha sp. 6PLUC6]
SLVWASYRSLITDGKRRLPYSVVFGKLGLGVRISVTQGNPIAGELFAQPNEYLWKFSWVPKLLRATYFVPWHPSPDEMYLQIFSIKALFWVSRLAGTCVFMSILGFFAGAFIVAGNHA